jgi:hypothetical protein
MRSVSHRAILALLVALSLVGAGCAGVQSTPTSDQAVPTDSPEPTPEPTDEPESTDEPDGSGEGSTGTPLADLIPDELNGEPGMPLPGMDQIVASALSQQGIDADELEFQFVTYGQTESAVVLTAFRIPGISGTAMESLARMMSGAQGAEGLGTEEVTIDGKSVLRMSAAQAAQAVVLLYFADGAAFTIASQDQASAEALLAELP